MAKGKRRGQEIRNREKDKEASALPKLRQQHRGKSGFHFQHYSPGDAGRKMGERWGHPRGNV